MDLISSFYISIVIVYTMGRRRGTSTNRGTSRRSISTNLRSLDNRSNAILPGGTPRSNPFCQIRSRVNAVRNYGSNDVNTTSSNSPGQQIQSTSKQNLHTHNANQQSDANQQSANQQSLQTSQAQRNLPIQTSGGNALLQNQSQQGQGIQQQQQQQIQQANARSTHPILDADQLLQGQGNLNVGLLNAGLNHVCNATQVSHTSNSTVNNSDNVVNTNHDNSVIMSSASNSSVLGGVLSNSGSLLNPVFVPKNVGQVLLILVVSLA